MDDVGVLVLVDQEIAPAALIFGEDFRPFAQQPQAFEQQVAEVDGVERFQPLLIEAVERRAAAVGETGRFVGRRMVGIEAAVLPAVDQRRQCARRPALVVDVLGLQDLLEQPKLIVGVEDGEIRLQPDQFGVATQNFGADRMERAEPRQAVGDAGQQLDPLAHLARRLVGESDGEDFVRPRPSRGDEMGDAGRQHPRLADAGAGQHQHRPVERLDGATLLGIEAGQVARREMRGGARRQGGLRGPRPGPGRSSRGMANHASPRRAGATEIRRPAVE